MLIDAVAPYLAVLGRWQSFCYICLDPVFIVGESKCRTSLLQVQCVHPGCIWAIARLLFLPHQSSVRLSNSAFPNSTQIYTTHGKTGTWLAKQQQEANACA